MPELLLAEERFRCWMKRGDGGQDWAKEELTEPREQIPKGERNVAEEKQVADRM